MRNKQFAPRFLHFQPRKYFVDGQRRNGDGLSSCERMSGAFVLGHGNKKREESPLPVDSYFRYYLSDESGLTDEVEHGVAENHADDTHGDTRLEHIVLLDQSGREGDSVRRSRDGETHGA